MALLIWVLAALGVFAGCAALAPAAASAAEGDFVFTGRGWGHGVGMSQWGAWKAAKEGVSFDKILAFYYPGTTLQQMSDPDSVVKVRLSANPPDSNVTSFCQVDLKPSVTAATLVKKSAAGDQTEVLPADTLMNVLNVDGKIQVMITADGPQGPFDYIELRPERCAGTPADGRVAVQFKSTPTSSPYAYREYWGTIRVQPGSTAGTLWVYNFVAVDMYVRNIGEVDLDWAMPTQPGYAIEVVKAQAVAARTYALAKAGATLTDGWQDQYYAGYRLEASGKYPGLALAAEQTAGLILTYQGKPATTYFSAHSGGYTTNTAWSGTYPPYIVCQPDPWSLKAPPSNTGYNWTYTISPADLSKKVNNVLTDLDTKKKFDIGLVRQVEVMARDTADPTSHARTIRLTGDKGTALVSAASLKSALGLKSTLILSITGGEPLGVGEFFDVGRDHLYHDQIARMVTAGLMNGYDGGLFKPEGSITRWQFAKIAVNLYNIMHPDHPIEVVDVDTRPFADIPARPGVLLDESDWVAAAKKAGLVTGMTGNDFQPYVVMRRDHMAAMTVRALGWEDEARALANTLPGFSDLSRSSEYWAAAAYLKAQGIMLGYEDGTLRPQEPIKRQHVAVILCRVLEAMMK
jgi:SpoIID/LytB domain protein